MFLRSDRFPALSQDPAKVFAASWTAPFNGSPALPHDLLQAAPISVQAFHPNAVKTPNTKGALPLQLAEAMMGAEENVSRARIE